MGRLYIETAQENGRTYVQDSFFTAPFKITKPFEIRKAVEIMIMQASAASLRVIDMKLNLKYAVEAM